MCGRAVSSEARTALPLLVLLIQVSRSSCSRLGGTSLGCLTRPVLRMRRARSCGAPWLRSCCSVIASTSRRSRGRRIFIFPAPPRHRALSVQAISCSADRLSHSASSGSATPGSWRVLAGQIGSSLPRNMHSDELLACVYSHGLRMLAILLPFVQQSSRFDLPAGWQGRELRVDLPDS